MFTATLGRLAAGENLTQEEMTAAMDAVMEGRVADEQIGLFLTALSVKGETVEEIAGAARSLRKHMTPIQTRHEIVVDTCGTGGVGSKLWRDWQSLDANLRNVPDFVDEHRSRYVADAPVDRVLGLIRKRLRGIGGDALVGNVNRRPPAHPATTRR